MVGDCRVSFAVKPKGRTAFVYLANKSTRTAEGYNYIRNSLKITVDAYNGAWDGRWYFRAFFDDETPLGSSASQEAKIDSLPQSWACLSGAAI